MMNIRIVTIVIATVLVCQSCTHWDCNKCIIAMHSSDPDDIVDACFYYRENPSEVCKPCVEAIFCNIMDGRVIGSIKGYGGTPFVLKIALLEKISGIPSEVRIRTHPDSVYLKPYIDWYEKKYR